MHARTSFIGRCGILAFLALAVLSTSGCSHVQFGSYASFDDWYVARDNVFRVDQLGFTGMDGTFAGYVINDVIIRTPVYVVYEATWLVLLPVALPYYGVKSLTQGSDDVEPPEEAKSAPEPPPETDAADEGESSPGEVEGASEAPGDDTPESGTADEGDSPPTKGESDTPGEEPPGS